MVMRQRLFFFMVMTLLVLTACARKGAMDVPEGCTSGDDVPNAVQTALESAAQELYDRAGRNDWSGIYDNAAEEVQKLSPARSGS